MNKWVITTISAYLISVIVVIAGFFLLDIEHIPLNYWALGSLIFSFTVSMSSMLTIVVKKKSGGNLFYTMGGFISLIVYELGVIISVLLIGLFSENVNRFILVQIIIFAMYLIIFIIFTAFSKHINKSDNNTSEKIENGEFLSAKRGNF